MLSNACSSYSNNGIPQICQTQGNLLVAAAASEGPDTSILLWHVSEDLQKQALSDLFSSLFRASLGDQMQLLMSSITACLFFICVFQIVAGN